MKNIILNIRNLFFNKQVYVVTKVNSGVKYYYLGKGNKWTPMFEGAKKYPKQHNLEWWKNHHKIEQY